VYANTGTVGSKTGQAFALLVSMQLVLIAGITVITVALPAVQRDLGLTRSDLALVTAAYGLSFGGLLMLGGRLADLAGRRRIFRIGVVIFGTGSVAAAVSPGLVSLVAARFVQGVGAALVAPAALALLGAVYPDPEQRARRSALWGGVNGIGATAGTLLGGVVVTFGSWRWAFAVPAVVALVVAVLAPRLLPAPPPRRSTVDVPSALLITLGVSLVSYGFLRSGERPAVEVYGSIVAGVGVLIWFLLRQRSSPDPMLPLAFLASPRRAAGVVTIFVMAGGMATSVFLLALHFQQELGYSPLATSAAFLPYGVVQVATGLVTGRLIARFGARPVTVLGLVLVAAGLVLFDLGPIHAGLVAFAAGSALAFSGAMVVAVDGVPDHRAGIAGGVVNTAMETGPTVGFAVLISLGGSAFVVAAAAFLVTAALAALTVKEKRT
jgi:MFS family permease